MITSYFSKLCYLIVSYGDAIRHDDQHAIEALKQQIYELAASVGEQAEDIKKMLDKVEELDSETAAKMKVTRWLQDTFVDVCPSIRLASGPNTAADILHDTLERWRHLADPKNWNWLCTVCGVVPVDRCPQCGLNENELVSPTIPIDECPIIEGEKINGPVEPLDKIDLPDDSRAVVALRCFEQWCVEESKKYESCRGVWTNVLRRIRSMIDEETQRDIDR